MKDWVHPRTIVGATAEGEKYFRRERIEEKLWREIKKGNHILFSAPRRVGKSSIMKYVASQPNDVHPEYICTYQNISSDNSARDFYKRLFELVVMRVNRTGRAKEKLANWIQSIGIEEITTAGVKFNSQEIDYKDSLMRLLNQLKGAEIRIVLFLDEFPDVIKNISLDESPEAAKDILQTLRSLRHDKNFKGHFTLVLAGSIGLDHVVKNIDRLAVINDLYEQNLPALNREEAHAFVVHLTSSATMNVPEEVTDHIIDRLGRAIPFFIQLIIEKCDDLLYDARRPDLTKEDIDLAWTTILKEHKHFSDWDERLEDYFPDDYPFLNEVLTLCAHTQTSPIQELYNLAVKHDKELSYKGLIDDVLIKDGYLLQEATTFTFVSPMLREWWKNRHPVLPEKKKAKIKKKKGSK